MKPLTTINGRDALVRAAVVVVSAALLIVAVAGALGAAGVDANTMLFVVVLMTLFAVVGGIVVIMLWALLPWLLRRTEHRLWEGKMKLDQAEILRVRGLSDRGSLFRN